MPRKHAFLLSALILCCAISPAIGSEQITTTGLIPGSEKGKLIVRGIYPGSAAEKAGLRAGQQIEAVHLGRDWETVSMDTLPRTFAHLNNPRGESVRIKVRGGREHTLKIQTIDIEKLTFSTAPRTHVLRPGLISTVDGTTLKANYGAFSPVKTGDTFALFQQGRITGTAEIRKIDNHGSELSVRIFGKRVRTHDDFAALRGAQLYLIRSSSSFCHDEFQAYAKKRDALRNKVKEYEKKAKDGTYQQLGATVQDLSKSPPRFLFRIVHGRSLGSHVSGGQVVETVMFAGKGRTYRILCMPHTKYIDMTNVDNDGRASFANVKEGEGATVFCSPNPKTVKDGDETITEYVAEVVVLK